MPSQLLRHVCLVLCLALLWGCAAKAPVVYKGRQSIADLENFPQDLNAYLGADQNSPILTPAEAADALAKYRSTLYAAWSMKKPSISKERVPKVEERGVGNHAQKCKHGLLPQYEQARHCGADYGFAGNANAHAPLHKAHA